MTRTMSLRARLVLIILTSLMLISLILGGFAFQDAKARANDRFDRSLLSTVLAISRDTALSGGDALSPATLNLLGDTSGGPVFYHVYAPNGAYVTGYATPPVNRVPNLSWHDVFSTVVNDVEATNIARNAARAKELNILEMNRPMRWSEGFGRFGLDGAHATLMFLGAGETQPQLHNPDYDFPDVLLPLSAGLFLAIVEQILSADVV